jgi:hypothetical protein
MGKALNIASIYNIVLADPVSLNFYFYMFPFIYFFVFKFSILSSQSFLRRTFGKYQTYPAKFIYPQLFIHGNYQYDELMISENHRSIPLSLFSL